ncbi:bifunctional folylpolyglutamate synthase/dihydrofolate synthase [Streptococcus sp. zg-JUN1979]|uniref:bifunctional folylpolyglutamate synthase/dihydrofolate synthase n=1 Tax=Streptococcus sp. zg-JUN1979 TaxID=3391450 RepID=UPI0039AEA396
MDTLAWIHSHKANGRRPNHDRMAFLLEQLGNPQDNVPLVHVVGTNGKGSTTAYLQALLSASGYRCGTFTSPYITSFNERIAIDKKPIADQDLEAICLKIKPLLKDLPHHLGRITEFELVTLIMFCYFKQERPDMAIIEAGVGGLEDATNCFHALAVICPSISYDHMDTLGEHLSDIAKHKAGVLTDKEPVFVGELNQDALEVFYHKAHKTHSPLYRIHHDFYLHSQGNDFYVENKNLLLGPICLAMQGYHQQINACLAIQTALYLKAQFPLLDPQRFAAILKPVTLYGRSEWLLDNLMIDGAHNPSGMDSLLQSLEQEKRPCHFLVAGLKRKPITPLLNQLNAYHVSVTSFPFYEARALDDYPDNYPRLDSLNDWFLQAKRHPEKCYVVTGSLYFISYVREAFFNWQEELKNTHSLIYSPYSGQ